MNMKIENQKDLVELLSHIAKDVVSASMYNSLFVDLINSEKQYKKEFNEAKTFWFLIATSLRENVQFYLCRAYDQYRDTISLHNVLTEAQQKLYLFMEAPEPAQLERDIDFASDNNPIVKRLML